MKYLHSSRTPLNTTRTQAAHLYSCLVKNDGDNNNNNIPSPPRCEGRDDYDDDNDNDEGAIKSNEIQQLPAPNQEQHSSSRQQGSPGGSFVVAAADAKNVPS